MKFWIPLLFLLSACTGHDSDHDDHASEQPHAESHDHDGHDEDHGSTISEAMADANALEIGIAQAGTITITRRLSGRVHTDPARLSRVRPRYAGLIETVNAKPWDRVEAGSVLARVQSNDSLQSYPVKAPIGGWVVNRSAQVGEITGDEPLFLIADLSELWVEFDVFDHDLDAIRIGQEVQIFGLHDESLGQGRLDRLSPLAIHHSQSVRARVIVGNLDGRLRPGQYVRGEVIVEKAQADIVVPRSAVQSIDGEDVVFEKHDDQYEPRPVRLGRMNQAQVEILSGLNSGASVVTSNSYLIKADLEKAGTSHAH